MRLSRLHLIAFLGIFLSVAPVPVWAFNGTQDYIEKQALPPQLLLPPPAEGSTAWKRQIEAVLHAQESITPADMTALKDEQAVRAEMLTSVLGPSFTRDRLPKTFALLDRAQKEAGGIIETDKKFWHTRRPYLTDSRVKLNVDAINDSPAYPSGHTAASRVLAEILGLLVPEKLSVLRARADAIARHRVQAGVHYPVDLEGGRALAMLIVGALMANDDFQEDLSTARKEITGK